MRTVTAGMAVLCSLRRWLPGAEIIGQKETFYHFYNFNISTFFPFLAQQRLTGADSGDGDPGLIILF